MCLNIIGKARKTIPPADSGHGSMTVRCVFWILLWYCFHNFSLPVYAVTVLCHSYAGEGADVVLHGIRVSDNIITRGSAIFIDNSNLSTYQVREVRESRRGTKRTF